MILTSLVQLSPGMTLPCRSGWWIPNASCWSGIRRARVSQGFLALFNSHLKQPEGERPRGSATGRSRWLERVIARQVPRPLPPGCIRLAARGHEPGMRRGPSPLLADRAACRAVATPPGDGCQRDPASNDKHPGPCFTQKAPQPRLGDPYRLPDRPGCPAAWEPGGMSRSEMGHQVRERLDDVPEHEPAQRGDQASSLPPFNGSAWIDSGTLAVKAKT